MEHAGSNGAVEGDPEWRDRTVRRLLLLEAAANLVVLSAKTFVGLSTGSLSILGDALHSLTDLANNALALVVMRFAARPADREHPYGHRKFETLAVFGLAGLLTVMAVEIALRALQSPEREIVTSSASLGAMLGVLLVNVVIAIWQGRWARRVDSDILRADARHTMGDVLTTVVVIVGWQLSARGLSWLDSVFALAVAGIVLFLAFGLFKRSIPILVDRMAVAPEKLGRAVDSVIGVQEIERIRSRHGGASPSVDIVVKVDPQLSVVEGHRVANEIERVMREDFEIDDVIVHVEPRSGEH